MVMTMMMMMMMMVMMMVVQWDPCVQVAGCSKREKSIGCKHGSINYGRYFTPVGAVGRQEARWDSPLLTNYTLAYFTLPYLMLSICTTYE